MHGRGMKVGEPDKCIEKMQRFTCAVQQDQWLKINAIGLQDFWAKNKSDALELKKEFEKRRGELVAAESIDADSIPY